MARAILAVQRKGCELKVLITGANQGLGDLHKGAETQVWLATSTVPEALTTGGHWYHKNQQQPHPITRDGALQNQLIAALAEHTKVTL